MNHSDKFHELDLKRMQYSRIRLYHPPPDRTEVADISGWMIKLVGPNSSFKYQLYCENNQIKHFQCMYYLISLNFLLKQPNFNIS